MTIHIHEPLFFYEATAPTTASYPSASYPSPKPPLPLPRDAQSHAPPPLAVPHLVLSTESTEKAPPKMLLRMFQSTEDRSLALRHRFLDHIKLHAQKQAYSQRTIKTYLHWMGRFWDRWQEDLHNHLSTPTHHGFPLSYTQLQEAIAAFLHELASTPPHRPNAQSQSRAALFFLTKILFPQEAHQKIAQKSHSISSSVHALAIPQKIVRSLFQQMEEPTRMAALLVYGSGLRLFEVLRLRVRDVDLKRACLLVRDAQGKPTRVTLLPKALLEPLQAHLDSCRWRYDEDCYHQHAAVRLPSAIRRQQPSLAHSWAWRYLFMGYKNLYHPSHGEIQDHLHESTLQKSLQRAAERIGFKEKISCCRLRASFSTHLEEAGYPPHLIRLLCADHALSWTDQDTFSLPPEIAALPSPLDLWKPAYGNDPFDRPLRILHAYRP